MPTLTIKQRLFLEYLRDKHNCFGYEGTIPTVLADGCYDDGSINILNDIVKDFIDCRDLARKNGFDDYGGRPTKYLK